MATNLDRRGVGRDGGARATSASGVVGVGKAGVVDRAVAKVVGLALDVRQVVALDARSEELRLNLRGGGVWVNEHSWVDE